jgi:hypothetical protein
MNNVDNGAGEQEAAAESISADAFKLERYKYVLKQIHFLNENVNKYLAIVGAGAAVFMSWRKDLYSATILRLLDATLLTGDAQN